MSDWNDRIISEFRENNGVVGGPFAGSHLLLLHTTGAKSGKERVSPMMYFVEPEGLFVVASKAGAHEHPGWFHNLTNDPEVSVEQSTEHGIQTFGATAEQVEPALRDELYARFVKRAPGFGAYQEKTDRVIPVVRLHPTEGT